MRTYLRGSDAGGEVMQAHHHAPTAQRAHEAGDVGSVPLLKQFLELDAVA